MANLYLITAGIWEQAVPVSESVSHFLQLPLRELAEVEKPGSRRLRPRAARSLVRDRSGRSLDVYIPTPEAGPWIARLLFVGVCWCIPVGLMSRSLSHTLGPLVIVAATVLKCGPACNRSQEVVFEFLHSLGRERPLESF